jgi:hypothetical protein
MGKLISLVALACFVSAAAHAKEDRLACKADADCAVAENPCGGVRPLNKKYLNDNEEFRAKLQPLMQCQEGATTEADPFTAVCKDKKCVLVKKAEPKPSPPPSLAPKQ